MEVKKQKKKLRWWGYLLIVAFTAALILIFLGILGGRYMNRTVEDGLKALRQHYTVTEADAGEFSELKLYGIMKFNTERYEVEGLGNLCIMTMNMGVMQMSTFVLTPYEKNMPMLSMDFIYTPGNRKALVEVYDLVEDTQTEDYQAVLAALQQTFDSFSDLEDTEASPGWYDDLITVKAYKKGNSAQDERIAQLFTDSVETYAAVSEELLPLTGEKRAAKLAITQEYCGTMVEKGGLSTDMFKKALGDEVTARFFNTVFFGPANY